MTRRAWLFGAAALMLSAVAAAQGTKVSVSMAAVRASTEGREEKKVDPALSEVRESLVVLPYDTFSRLTAARADIAYGAKKEFPIDRRYTLVVHPIARDAAGRVRVQVRVDERVETEKGKVRKRTALEVTRTAEPGKSLTLCGLKPADDGEPSRGRSATKSELVLVVTVRPVER